jgi:hypothetical protein
MTRAYMHRATLAIALGSALFTLSSNANAQTAVANQEHEHISSAVQILRAACGGDLAKFCPAGTPSEGRLFFEFWRAKQQCKG